MSNTVLISLVLACLPLAACGSYPPSVVAVPPGLAPELGRPGVMTVTGTATLEVAPDCADLTMTVSADDVKPSAATRAVHVKRDGLLDALGKAGVGRDDIKLSVVTMSPIYERSSDSWEATRVRAYRAEITLVATTRKLDHIAGIMEASTSMGVSQVWTGFRRSDLPQLKARVRDMALTAARAKAKQIADALDIKLGRIVSVSETPNDRSFALVSNSQASEKSSGGALDATAQPLTVDISLGFELASR